MDILSSEDSEPLLNNMQYIIAGPEKNDYWAHSPGFKQPLINTEGPFLMQGNIGSLMVNDPLYESCIKDQNIAPSIGSSPNCSSVFISDMYTKVDTCGEECTIKYPESYGLKDFGFPEGTTWINKLTNASSLHAYDNLRAAGPGQGPGTFGALEFIPRIGIQGTGSQSSGFLDPVKEYEQIGNFLNLPDYENLAKVSWTKFK